MHQRAKCIPGGYAYDAMPAKKACAEQWAFERAQRLQFEARFCSVQRANSDLTVDLLAERFGIGEGRVRSIARKHGLKIPSAEYWTETYARRARR